MRKIRLLIITDDIEKWMKEVEIDNPDEKMMSRNKAFISYGILCVDIVSSIEPRYFHACHYDKVICDKSIGSKTERMLRCLMPSSFIYTDLGLISKREIEEDE